MISFGISDKGKRRDHNEDKIFLSDKPIGKLPNLYIVADGVGGRVAGNIASSFAVEKFKNYICDCKEDLHPLEIMSKGIKEINKYIHHKSKNSYEFNGMATTFLAVMIKGNKVYAVNVGDSRLYLVNSKGIKQATVDNSYYNELKNIILEDVKVNKNILSRAVGQADNIQVDTYEIEYDKINSHILVCTDGLNKMLNDKEIHQIYKNHKHIHKCVNNLVESANQKGGFDNISVILVGSE